MGSPGTGAAVVREWVYGRFEQVLVVAILGGVAVLNCLVLQKLAFLDFFFLPVLAAGYWLGRSKAVSTAVMCVLVALLYMTLDPGRFSYSAGSEAFVWWHMGTWAAFLIISAVLLGTLADQKSRQIGDLEDAYHGVLEILMKYLDSVDRHTKSHSVRVSELAVSIASEMSLSDQEVETIKVAALLHDIGKIDVSTDLIRRAADLDEAQRQVVAQHIEDGAKLMGMVGRILSDAIPLVIAHHKHFSSSDAPRREADASVPLGARVIAVADAYDAMVTDRPYRAGKPPWETIKSLQSGAGSQFDPEVVEAFAKVMQRGLADAA
jgi:putative nucleotidyltransferase with HDIG domain